MNDKELTQDDFLQRIDIRDILLDAGYRQNRRFGLRLSSFIRTDNEGKRIRGDKFVITQHGKCCCQPPQQKEYNVVSFIKEHPTLFAEYYEGMDLNQLVDLVCSRLLNIPVEEEYEVPIVQPQREIRPFDITEYDIQKFDPKDREVQKKFAPISSTAVLTSARSTPFTGISVWQPDTAKTGIGTSASLSRWRYPKIRTES